MKHSRSFFLGNAFAMPFLIIAIAPVILAALFLSFPGIFQTEEKNNGPVQASFFLENHLDKQAALLHDISNQLKGESGRPLSGILPLGSDEKTGIYFDAVYLLDKNGQVTEIFRQTRHPAENEKSGTGPVAIRHFLSGRNHSQPYWSNLFFSPVTHDNACAYIIPAADHFLVGEITTPHFSGILKEQHFPFITLVLDRDNRPIASAIDAFSSRQAMPPPLDVSKAETPGLYRLQDIRGNRVALRDTSWSIFTALSPASFSEKFKAQAPFFLLSITGGFILALAFSFYFSRLLNQRILAYINNAREIAGDTYPAEQKLAEKITWQQNYFDSLTGLPNRHFLKKELSRARQINMPVALMSLDLDEFKDINETLGHAVGDLLLQETARRLLGYVRKTDTIVRLGSDEFAILLRERIHPEEIGHIGKNILFGLSEPFFLNHTLVHISASIGVTFYPEDATDIDDLLKNADQAMHAAKREGKNTLLYFTRAMQEMAQARMQLVNDLRKALADRQFEILYQPIVEMESGMIRKAEALIRWQHPVRGTINPVEFIPIAEDTGMIASFGNWIFHEASNQAHLWRNRFHPDFQISINLSPVQFKKEGIDLPNWMSHLQELQLPGSGLVVEITEGFLLESSHHVKQQLAAFKNAGMEIALDDFGIGYASLSYLQDFNFDYLKIDQSFIKNLPRKGDSQTLCEAIIALAHKLNLKVIAEGIETIHQREFLVNAGCDFGQGYLYSTPLSVIAFEQVLENNHALFNLNFQAGTS